LPRSLSTPAIVLGSRKLGEADRIVTMLTEEQGMVPVVAKGSRKVKSRFGGRLEPFTHLQVQLHEGRSLHTLTGADTVKTHAASRSVPAALTAGLAFVDLLRRSIPEHERRPRTFNLLSNYLGESDRAASHEHDPSGFKVMAMAAQLKLLLLLGYLPHLAHCSVCGAAASPVRFSATAGGALCSQCPGESIKVHPGALILMRRLLEEPLSSSWRQEADEELIEDTWRCIRELCRYHLGFDPRLHP
jgi:DNA repair protein RecO (recombination protein O)